MRGIPGLWRWDFNGVWWLRLASWPLLLPRLGALNRTGGRVAPAHRGPRLWSLRPSARRRGGERIRCPHWSGVPATYRTWALIAPGVFWGLWLVRRWDLVAAFPVGHYVTLAVPTFRPVHETVIAYQGFLQPTTQLAGTPGLQRPPSMLCSLHVVQRLLIKPFYWREFDLCSKAPAIQTRSVSGHSTGFEVIKGGRLSCRST
jgi:hypothetical protein